MIKSWLDGKLCKKEEAVLNLESAALHYGCVVFEGIMAVGIKEGGRRQVVLFRVSEHIDRFLGSAEILGLTVRYSHKEIIEAISNAVISNGWRNYYVRPLLYSRKSYLELTHQDIPATLVVLVRPFNFRIFSLKMRMPISLMIFGGLVNPFKGKFSSMKVSGRYLVNMIAKRQAYSSGYDDAILLDQSSNATETAAANIFMIKNNKIYTPHLGNIIEGITRKTAIGILSTMGIGVQEKDISKEELLESEAVFISGTAAGIVSAHKICQRKLDSRPKIIVELQNRYLKMLGAKDKKRSSYAVYL